MTETLAGLGETELLQRLARFAPAGQLSDDTACLAPDTRPLLINTDVLVDGVHFSDTTTAPDDVGWRAVSANLSDLAASGAISMDGITVALVAPGETHWDWVNGVYNGIAEALSSFGGILLGGDCSTGEERLLSLTALGRLGPCRLHRGHACPGDVLVTSGVHGLSRLGLALLLGDPDVDRSILSASLQAEAIQRHRRPIPRFDALQALLDCKPAQLPWRAGGTDSSDGLLAGIGELCASSNCGALLDRDQLPKAAEWPNGPAWDQWCLAGGEDFELVLSLPPAWADAWLQAFPEGRRLGSVHAGINAVLWSDDRTAVRAPGFDHFGRPATKNPPRREGRDQA